MAPLGASKVLVGAIRRRLAVLVSYVALLWLSHSLRLINQLEALHFLRSSAFWDCAWFELAELRIRFIYCATSSLQPLAVFVLFFYL